ncbi:MAG: M20/M25/M40 family metallo-hydrolase [Planctomycetes bacterium]|nr:M20/M25/M40 family metallo-hydrolase [Planctomycetota bacterium]
MAFAVSVVLAAWSGVVSSARAQEIPDGPFKPALASITAAECRAHVEHLASDALAGRDTFSPGNDAAAEYVARHFKAAGLLPPVKPEAGKPPSYFQVFEATDWRGKTGRVRNVAALFEGADAKSRDEAIVIGAHYDHLGVGPNGEIFHGADDNASGTAALLEVAQAFGKAKPAVKRSVLFVAFSGEERGLLGSRHYVDDPIWPLEKTVAMINIDMCSRPFFGRRFAAAAVGTESSPEVRTAVDGAAKGAGLAVRHHTVKTLRMLWGAATGDWHPFWKKEVPIVFFSTSMHADYHQPTDTADKADAEVMERVARTTFLTAATLADAEGRPRFVAPKDGETPAGPGAAPAQPPVPAPAQPRVPAPTQPRVPAPAGNPDTPSQPAEPAADEF